jgi:hypothetical protein
MGYIANVKIKYEADTHRIPATEIKREPGKLVVYNGDKIVGEFELIKVEHWALELES